MKTIFKTLILTVAAMATLSACAKWTETKPITVTYVTNETKNPQLYAQYLQSLRDYRETEHQVLMAKFDNEAGIPSVRNQHISNLPDSVDYVILMNPTRVSAAHLEEMAQMKEDKGIQTLAEVNLTKIAATYVDLIAAEQKAYEALEEPTEEDAVVDTPERFESVVTPLVEDALKGVDKVGAMYLVFDSKNPYTYSDEKKADVAAIQSLLFAKVNQWLSAHADALVIFEGVPGHILCDTPVIGRARYIVVDARDAHNAQTLSYKVAFAQFASPEMPVDRIVIGVTTIDDSDPSNTDGYFSNGISAIEGAAYWAINAEEGYSKKGICVTNAQDDYYGKERIYAEINKAIAIMNPTL